MAGALEARVQAHLREESDQPYCNGRSAKKGQSERTLFEKELLLSHSPPVDIMIRTSGVHRLSDFMLWQITDRTTLHFVSTFWPVFGLRDMLPILLEWQQAQFKRWLWKDGLESSRIEDRLAKDSRRRTR